MTEILRYRGRNITESEVAFIRQLIADNPALSRRALSAKLCEAWSWRQANGALRDMVCRGLMLALHRAGLIELPPVRQVTLNPLARSATERRARTPVVIDTTVLNCSLAALQPLSIVQVRRSEAEALFDSLLEQHHYLGYVQPVGEHLKYLVYDRSGRVLACLAWSSAPRHLGARDRHIGWDAASRRRNIRFIAYNTRFLILPHVQVAHMASHILGLCARRISADWEQVYGHPLYFLETFIDPSRFRGTCYRAANWVRMGLTTGRGKADQTKKPNRPIKEIFGYALRRDFREQLQAA